MSKRFDNKRLLFILGGLLLILILTIVVKIPKEKSTLKGNLVEFDTSHVSKIIFYPKKAEGEQFEFVRSGEGWTVRQNNIISVPQRGAIQSIFNSLLEIKPKSLAAVDRSKWKEFELTDSLAVRVRLLNVRNTDLADVMIGSFTYKQVNDPYSGYGGNNIEGTSFVRLYDRKEVYAVDGFLSFAFSGDFNDWRDKTFLRCKKEDISKITFTGPGDTGYVLALKDSTWYAGNQHADSALTAGYLNTISYIDGEDFKDNYNPASSPDYQLNIEGNNLVNFTIKCYRGEKEGEYIMNSNLNPDIYFTGNADGIYGKLFKPASYFIKQVKNLKK